MWRRQGVWKMEYRDVERSSVYTQPLAQDLRGSRSKSPPAKGRPIRQVGKWLAMRPPRESRGYNNIDSSNEQIN